MMRTTDARVTTDSCVCASWHCRRRFAIVVVWLLDWTGLVLISSQRPSFLHIQAHGGRRGHIR